MQHLFLKTRNTYGASSWQPIKTHFVSLSANKALSSYCGTNELNSKRHYGKGCVFVQILILVSIQYAYQKQEQHDCLVRNDLHSLESDRSSTHANCMDWCNINGKCGGFTVHATTCYFKGQTCSSDLSSVHYNTNLFLKEGS